MGPLAFAQTLPGNESSHLTRVVFQMYVIRMVSLVWSSPQPPCIFRLAVFSGTV